MKINRDKNIGKVLFIVEGEKTELKLLHTIFTKILDYKYETFNRQSVYKKSNPQKTKNSSVFVINTKNSNIKSIVDDIEYIDNLYLILLNDYNFNVDHATIFYLFDRDVKTNTDIELINTLLKNFSNPLESVGFERPGLLLLNYPSLESFIISNFVKDTYKLSFETGIELKQYLIKNKISPNQVKINDTHLLSSVVEMDNTLDQLGISKYDIDNFRETNLAIFAKQEAFYKINKKFRLLSLLTIALKFLGIIDNN